MAKKKEDWQEEQYRHQQIIEEAVKAADRIILDGSDGSTEETDYLASEVAKKFSEKVVISLRRNIIERQIKKD